MATKCYKKLVYSSRPTQTNSYIVIHNSAGGVAEGVYATFIDNKNLGSNICAHYAVDDKNIIQLLEDNWNGQHTTGVGYYKEWGTKANGVSNSNSIGIEVADGAQVNMNTANDNCVELVRYLMKAYNIPISNVVRHGDTQNKNCPQTIMKNSKWDLMLKTIKERNNSNLALKIDSSGFKKSDMTSNEVLDGSSDTNSTTTSGQVVVQLVFANDGNTTVQESLPNANTSDNWVDMHKIKGITLHMYPPYQNCCDVENMEKTFKVLNWDRAFHYKVDYKTTINYSKKVPLISGPSTGGNTIGSSLSDFVLIPGEGIYSGGVINSGSSDSSSGSSDNSDFTGNSTEEVIFNFFRGKGCSIQTSCGIMGNARGESGLSTTIVNSSSTATGLFQWIGSRFTNLKNYATQQSKDWTDLEVQLEFSWSELTGSECASGLKKWGGLDKFKSLTSVEDATLAWEIVFERSGGQGNSTRVNYAKEYYEKYKNYTKPSNAPNTGNDSSVHGWPLPSSCTNVSSKFGVPRSNGRTHKGIDIAISTGTNVYAYAAGTVESKDYHSSRGNYIKINHGNGTYTWYEHLSSFKVSKNDKVSSGQIIALSGNTGDSSGPHLHFELWKNNVAVDPLNYITIGGGAKSVSIFNAVSNDLFKTMDITSNDVTYENIDRSKICFACADNKQHTYIDRALFNNENAKYTVSIGAFFDDQSNEIERDANITDSDKGWPRAEKKLIQQCAQALYFEGFTTDNLWREFDLNRAPSPFIYLDREKWELFLDEVKKQVEWLNGKYGKVTSTYVPNNLLANKNLNDFIEMSPDLGVKGLDDINSTSTKIESMDGGFFLGDKFIYLMEESELLSGIDTICKNDLVNPWNYYGEYNGKKYDKTSEFPTSPKYIFVNLGSNLPSKIAEMQVLLNKLKSMYSDIPIFVSKLFYPNKKVKSINLDSRIKGIDKFNEAISSFCSSNGLYFIDATGNEFTENNYLNEKYCSTKFYFYTNKEGSKLYFENIKSAILSTDIISNTSSSDNSSNNSSDNSSDDDTTVDNDDTYESKYSYISSTSAKFYTLVYDTYSEKTTYYKYQEVKILSSKNAKGYYKVSVKGMIGYMKASALTIINNNTYGYTYKNNIGKTASIWKDTALYKEASIYSDILEVKNDITSCTILDTDVNFYKVSLGTNSLSYGGTTGWIKAYRINIASNTSSLFSIKEIQADGNNNGLYAYVESDVEISMYKDADEESKVVSTYYRGDEFLIQGASKSYYKVKNTGDNKIGYIKATDLYIISTDKYGRADKENINKKCYVKYNNTSIYEKDNTDDAFPNLIDQKQEGKIVDTSNGYYKVVFLEYNLTGWIKAYRITTSRSYFNFEKDEIGDLIGNVNEITLKNYDFEYELDSEDSNTSDETTDTDNNNLDALKEGWETEGDIQFEIVKNEDDIKDGRFVYRGNYFARLKNTKESLAGIKQKITIDEISSNENDTEDGEFSIRVSVWLKQVTTDDDATGISTDSIDEYVENGITFYILNENNKVVSSTNVGLPKDTTCFGRVAALFTNIKAGNYIFLIGSKKKFDIYADNFIIEQISDYNDSIGDYITSGNIGTSGVGNTAFDNGGIMFYSQEKSTKTVSDSPPDITTIITQDEYDEIMKNANNVLIDAYVNSCEPYDKGLKEITEAPILEDDRLNTLTESINSFTGNMIRYSVVESGPGSTDHCVKSADELNVLYKQIDTNSEPIYPDLIIPPNYSTGDYDVNSNNSIPLQAIQDEILSNKDTLNKQFSFDYKTLEDKTKTSKGFAINYNDPYPYDDKITELEKHYPKVKIDEIESRLYSCNHPGCPIGLPMAKNFAMLSDMQLAQSKRIEQRLARIENVLASMVRNIGRIGSRMHINCVYYGGQDTFSKYLSIRCTHDDRIHDGCSMTLDQCLCCTRYEPIIGQIYDILDETGFNGSSILDDMQMSYMTLNDFKNLNRVERRSSKFDYSNNLKEEKDIPKSLIDIWNEKNLNKYKEKLKETKSEVEISEILKSAQKSDYSFIMDWSEQEIDIQSPDVKVYPTEGITAKYYVNKTEKADTSISDSKLNTSLNSDGLKDKNNVKLIASGEWIDTREKADTTQNNKYTSEDFYFENFNLNRTGYEYDNGLKGYVGIDVEQSSSGNVSNGVSANGAECRNKIVEWAEKTRQEHLDGKAQYSHSNQTYDPNDLHYYKGTLAGCTNPLLYDCSSLSSTCYKYAGLTSLFRKVCSGGTIMKEICNNGGQMWLADTNGLAKALPGDCIVRCKNKHKPTQAEMDSKTELAIEHIMIYVGDGKIIHASTTANPPGGIKKDEWNSNHYSWSSSFFIRPKDLIEADSISDSNSGDGVIEKNGTVDGNSYVCTLEKCRLTAYGTWDGSSNITATGKKLSSNANNIVAAHNMPYGTKIYVPLLKGVVNDTGIFTVEDTGGCCFDFDVCTSSSSIGSKFSSKTAKAYVLSWGSGSIASSFTAAVKAQGGIDKYKTAWNNFKKTGGSTMNLLKFNTEDLNIKNQSWY